MVALQEQICLPIQETQVRFLGLEEPLEREITTHSSILAGKSYGQRSLAGYIVHGVAKESDTAKQEQRQQGPT